MSDWLASAATNRMVSARVLSAAANAGAMLQPTMLRTAWVVCRVVECVGLCQATQNARTEAPRRTWLVAGVSCLKEFTAGTPISKARVPGSI
jgi:hypothetical protein